MKKNALILSAIAGLGAAATPAALAAPAPARAKAPEACPVYRCVLAETPAVGADGQPTELPTVASAYPATATLRSAEREAKQIYPRLERSQLSVRSSCDRQGDRATGRLELELRQFTQKTWDSLDRATPSDREPDYEAPAILLTVQAEGSSLEARAPAYGIEVRCRAQGR